MSAGPDDVADALADELGGWIDHDLRSDEATNGLGWSFRASRRLAEVVRGVFEVEPVRTA